MHALSPVLPLVTAAIIAGPARAQIAFDTFAPGGTFTNQWFYNYGGTSGSVPNRLGFGFTSLASGPLTAVTAPVFRASSLATLTLELYADSTTTPGIPGALLLSTPITPPVYTSPPTVAPTFTLASGPQLTQGQSYYLVFAGLNFNSQLYWFLGGPDPDTAPHGLEVFHYPSNPPNWFTDSQAYAAFRLTVPAPGSTTALALGVAWTARRRRRPRL